MECPPVAEALLVFYVKKSSGTHVPDFIRFCLMIPMGPIVFKPYQNQLPEGVQMSSSGLIHWSPSKNQFNGLKTNPLTIEFVWQDQPEKREARRFALPKRIGFTNWDSYGFRDSVYEIKEDGLFNIKIYSHPIRMVMTIFRMDLWHRTAETIDIERET